MRSGSALLRPGTRIVVLALALSAMTAATALAQTTPEQCAADSLVLLSPEENGLRVSLARTGARFGTYVQWAELPDEIATCATITGDDSLGFTVEISGAYRDDVDRVLEFFTFDDGTVGSQDVDRLLYRWSNVFVSRSGRVEGAFNLSNSGGVLRYDRAGGWSQTNGGLPQYLPYTNVLALAEAPAQPGRLLMHLGATSTPGGDPRGLWLTSPGGDWQRVATSEFPDGRLITALAFAPSNDDTFAVGTARFGFFVSRNGGQDLVRFDRLELDPDYPDPPTYMEVTALTWGASGNLYVAVRAFGFFVSTDVGNTFQRLPNLMVPSVVTDPGSTPVFPYVNRIVEDPADDQHLWVAIRNHALYESTDGGDSWSSLTTSWVTAEGAQDGRCFARDPLDGQNYLVGTTGRGIWRTADGGATWAQVGADLVPDGVWTGRPVVDIVFDSQVAGDVWAVVDGIGFMQSTDGGATWAAALDEPSILSARRLIATADGSGGMWLATYGGGIYTPGTPVEISRTINRGTTEVDYRDLELGLSLTFSAGTVESGATFRLTCQDFQGYAIWRSDSTDPFTMELIGLYDKTNPETCIEGFCGDENYNITPNCFSEKRAACFDFSKPDSIQFFDDNVYNGFTYFYAVSLFDYGSTAGVEPTALARDMLFSPRYPSPTSLQLDPDVLVDGSTLYPGAGNLVSYQINVEAAGPLDGPEIYCFPNPLRRGAGFPGNEGEQVVFTNLPPRSRVRIFTVDGDEVADLGPDEQQDSNMFWWTRNDDNELLASGIYIWKVEMQQRGDYWGKLVIIR